MIGLFDPKELLGSKPSVWSAGRISAGPFCQRAFYLGVQMVSEVRSAIALIFLFFKK